MASPASVKNYYVLELLDSDDDFPSSYIDDEKQSLVKATCEDNCRFYPLFFSWLENNHQNWLVRNKKTSELLKHNKGTEFISQGFLKQKDLICLKAVAGSLSNDMFLWFVDYLVRKDFQSKFENNHISCLVEKLPCSMGVNEEHNFFKKKIRNSKEQNAFQKDYVMSVKVKVSVPYDNF